MVPPPPPAFWQLPAGTQLIAARGLATVLPDMDFETYSEAGYVWDAERNKWTCLPGAPQRKKGLGVVGAAAYSMHPSTDVLSFAYDLKDGLGRRVWFPGMPAPRDLFDWLARGGLVEAHNSAFEWWIWTYVCRRRYAWPELPLELLRCSMAKSRAHALPGALGLLGDVLKLTYPKDPAGDALLKKFSVPQNPTKKRLSTRIQPGDEPDEFARLVEYNVRDIVSEAEVSSVVPDLEGEELANWQLDQRINRRGAAVDLEGLENCIAIVEQAHAKYNEELRALTGGVVAAASELPSLKAWLGCQGVHAAAMDEESLDLLLARTDLPPHARRALEIRQAIGSAAVKKVFSMRCQLSPLGRLHDLFTYYGARTGRTTGNGPQPTNLPKAGPNVYKCGACGCHAGAHHKLACPWCQAPRPLEGKGSKPGEWSPEAADDALRCIATRNLATVEYVFGPGAAMETVGGCLRGLYVAGPGCDFVSSDYLAIEAVVLAMLAGVQWRIEVFRTHGKIYEASAAMMAKIPVEEVLAHKEIFGQHHPLRDKGKRAELACGYGGWVGAWIAFGADKYMTEDEMKTATLEWRAASPEIPEFWGGQWRRLEGYNNWRPELFGLEGHFIAAMLNPGQEFNYKGLRFLYAGDVMYLYLLSGRALKYHRPRLAREEKYGRAQFAISFEGYNTNPKNGPVGWIRMDTYGGRLTENVVQATARDIQWFGMRNLEAAGYPIVLHVYDEDVAEIPKGAGDLLEFERIMSTMPPWAHDWPIKASGGWRGWRYRKG